MTRKFWVIVVLISVFLEPIRCLEQQITVNIEPRRQDCFYQEIASEKTVEVDYQVIDGAHSDLDITFQTYDPRNRVVVGDFKKTGATHSFTSKEFGDYKFCFDNTFSTISTKTVFFELIIDGDDDSDEEDGTFAEEVHEMAVQDIMDIVVKVRSDLNKARQLQDIIKSIEARDRNVAEENHSTVNMFSFVQIAVMLIVGLIQVTMVRSLFDEKSRVHGLWKKVGDIK